MANKDHEKSGETLYSSNLFFSSSTHKPKNFKYDHVGFILDTPIDGKKFIQMSGHKQGVYLTSRQTDDPVFDNDDFKIYKLPKKVSVPLKDSYNSENCGTFVANVLKANSINIPIAAINKMIIEGLRARFHHRFQAQGDADTGGGGGD